MGGVPSLLVHGTDHKLVSWDGVSALDSQDDRNFRFAIHTFGELAESFVPEVAWSPAESMPRPGDLRAGAVPGAYTDAAAQKTGRAVPRSDFPDVPHRSDGAHGFFLGSGGNDAFLPLERMRIVSAYQAVLAICDATAAGRVYSSADMKRGGWFHKVPLLRKA